jgi:electron transfer flavoprotein beta subunit
VKIAVAVKEVPDTTADKRLKPDTFTLDRSVELILNPFDEYAVEEAIKLKEAGAAESVTLVCVGPETAANSVRKALAMGADAATIVTDDALAGSDGIATARALAGALRDGGYDLIMFGQEATDARGSIIPAAVAELLELPTVTQARRIEVSDTTVRGERQSDAGVDTVEAPLPAVVSVTKAINEPRYPSLKGIMGAKKKPTDVKGLGDVGVDPGQVGLANSGTSVLSATPPPPRGQAQIVTDDGNGSGAQAVLEFLIARKLI